MSFLEEGRFLVNRRFVWVLSVERNWIGSSGVVWWVEDVLVGEGIVWRNFDIE